MDNFPSEKNQRLLVGALFSSWGGPPPHELGDETLPAGVRRKFLAAANVGLYATPRSAAIVPDVLLSTDVALESMTWADDEPRAYLTWEMGKPPELVIEIVSNLEGDELVGKRRRYGQIHVSAYVVYDPGKKLGGGVLSAFELRGDLLQPVPVVGDQVLFETLGLGVRVWEGDFEGTHARWLRFVDSAGALLETGEERAERQGARADEERARADEERARADEEKARADDATKRAEGERVRAEEEKARADALEARLRALGIDPFG